MVLLNRVIMQAGPERRARWEAGGLLQPSMSMALTPPSSASVKRGTSKNSGDGGDDRSKALTSLSSVFEEGSGTLWRAYKKVRPPGNYAKRKYAKKKELKKLQFCWFVTN